MTGNPIFPSSVGVLAAVALFSCVFVNVAGYGYDADCVCSECPQFNAFSCNTAQTRCENMLPDGVELVEYACLAGDTGCACSWTATTSYVSHCPAELPSAESECQLYCGRMNCTHTYVCDLIPEDDDDKEWCFHEDTIISYRNALYTLDELRGGLQPECTIPHEASTRGVIVHTSCNRILRVTATHLIGTLRGYKEAASLLPNLDVIITDPSVFSEGTLCAVTSVEKENKNENYFGLNCIQSDIFANGLSVSTFGDLHALPSWYMYLTGSILGIDRASRIGTVLSGYYHSSGFKINKKMMNML